MVIGQLHQQLHAVGKKENQPMDFLMVIIVGGITREQKRQRRETWWRYSSS